MTKFPTAEDMRKFASKYSKDDWRRLCRSPKFNNLLVESIDAAAIWAEKVLEDWKKGVPPKE